MGNVNVLNVGWTWADYSKLVFGGLSMLRFVWILGTLLSAVL